MTECNQEAFSFAAHFSRRVEAGFTTGQVSSDGGALLLREVERRINLLERLTGCFTDRRNQELAGHKLRSGGWPCRAPNGPRLRSIPSGLSCSRSAPSSGSARDASCSR